MKSLLMLSLLLVLLSGCAKEKVKPPSVEETVLFTSLASLIAAQEYDLICNDGSVGKGVGDQGVNANLMGNTQILSGRFGGVQHLRFPDKSVEELLETMLKAKSKIQASMKAALASEGCEGEKGAAAAKTLQFYSETPPWILFGMIDQEIIKRGGTVTSMDEIEAVPVKK